MTIRRLERIQVDWQRLCLNLRYHHNLTALSLAQGFNYSYLNQYARGQTKQPRFDDGLLLLNLHLDLCGLEKTQQLEIKRGT